MGIEMEFEMGMSVVIGEGTRMGTEMEMQWEQADRERHRDGEGN